MDSLFRGLRNKLNACIRGPILFELSLQFFLSFFPWLEANSERIREVGQGRAFVRAVASGRSEAGSLDEPPALRTIVLGKMEEKCSMLPWSVSSFCSIGIGGRERPPKRSGAPEGVEARECREGSLPATTLPEALML